MAIEAPKLTALPAQIPIINMLDTEELDDSLDAITVDVRIDVLDVLESFNALIASWIDEKE